VYAVSGDVSARSISQRDPLTLAQRGPDVSLSPTAVPAGFSPDRALLAFVAWGEGNTPLLRLLDLRRFEWLRDVPLPATGTVVVRWLGARRLLALVEKPDGLRALVVEAAALRVVLSRPILGEHLTDRQQVAVTPAATAILLGPFLGATQVAVLRPAGAVRIVRLTRVRSGGSGRDQRRPALVADPTSGRAYVLGGLDEPIAEIDLHTLAVSYHPLWGGAAVPRTKLVERQAAWLGGGTLALAGFDEAGAVSVPLGLVLVNTRTWKARTLDQTAHFLWAGCRTLVGQRPGSLTAFSFAGARRFTLRDPAIMPPISLTTNGRYLYLTGFPDDTVRVLDCTTGSELARPQVEALGELLSPAS
jgi:hypothetical protein